MKKQCSNCEFNFGGFCAGHGDVYQYGETISDDTKCCDSWGASLEYYVNQTTTAPRFLRDAHNDCRISYHEFSKYVDDIRQDSNPFKCNADERCPLRLDAAESLFSARRQKMQIESCLSAPIINGRQTASHLL